jgi:hypothetical protein
MPTVYQREDNPGVVLVDADDQLLGAPDNPLYTAGAAADAVPLTVANSGLAAGTAVNGIVFDVDTTGYQSLVVQTLSTAFVGTLTMEGMNPGGTWVGIVGEVPGNAANAETGGITAINSALIFPCHFKRIRGRVSAYTSGSIQVSAILRETPPKNRDVRANVTNTTVPVETRASTAAPGSTLATVASVANVTPVQPKTTAGNIYDLCLSNNSAANRWIKFYDKSTAPVIATDTPKFKLLLKPGETLSVNLSGIARFAAGIAYVITAAVGNTDTTAPAVDDVTGFFTYA